MRPALVDHLVKAAKRLRNTAPNGDDVIYESPAFRAWTAQVELLIDSVGPSARILAQRLREGLGPDTRAQRLTVVRTGARHWNADMEQEDVNRWRTEATIGILDALSKALEGGPLKDLAVQVASEIHGDVLSEAEQLLNAGHLPCAAILTRVGLESGLRRRAA